MDMAARGGAVERAPNEGFHMHVPSERPDPSEKCPTSSCLRRQADTPQENRHINSIPWPNSSVGNSVPFGVPSQIFDFLVLLDRFVLLFTDPIRRGRHWMPKSRYPCEPTSSSVVRLGQDGTRQWRGKVVAFKL